MTGARIIDSGPSHRHRDGDTVAHTPVNPLSSLIQSAARCPESAAGALDGRRAAASCPPAPPRRRAARGRPTRARMNRGPKSSLQLYRDCMRLVKHLAGTTVRAARRGRVPHRTSAAPAGARRGAGRRRSPPALARALPLRPPATPPRDPPSQSQKSSQLRKIVSDQFRAHKDELDPARLHHLKQACVPPPPPPPPHARAASF